MPHFFLYVSLYWEFSLPSVPKPNRRWEEIPEYMEKSPLRPFVTVTSVPIERFPLTSWSVNCYIFNFPFLWKMVTRIKRNSKSLQQGTQTGIKIFTLQNSKTKEKNILSLVIRKVEQTLFHKLITDRIFGRREIFPFLLSGSPTPGIRERTPPPPLQGSNAYSD